MMTNGLIQHKADSCIHAHSGSRAPDKLEPEVKFKLHSESFKAQFVTFSAPVLEVGTRVI